MDDSDNLSDPEIVDNGCPGNEEALGCVFQSEIRPFIDVIDTLRRLGVNQDVKLPTVVVVGDQSSGKSSIIEALSAIQLPRGKGVVTRCPLELQLKRISGSNPWKATLSYRNKTIDTGNRDEVEYLIRDAQDEICGVEKDVKDELLTLRIESPLENAPDLTLIDLPGISRIPIPGQPENICETIRDIVTKHIRNECTVILCMISANLDFAVNESIQIARRVDPKCLRTIGVITKPDLADDSQKEDVIEILNNTKHKLNKGYVMVKCRSQKELESRISMEDAMENERNFFENDKFYRDADPLKLGTMNLATKISEELVAVIKRSIPDLKISIEKEQQKANARLSNLPDSIPQQSHEKHVYLNKLMWDLNGDIKKCLIDGKTQTGTSEDNCHHQWRKSFNKFNDDIEEKRKRSLNSKLSPSNLKELIARNRGKEINGFLNFELFEDLVKRHITNYDGDMILLANEMHKVIVRRLQDIVSHRLKHMPALERDLVSKVTEKSKLALEESVKECRRIFTQEGFVFTMDNLFHEGMERLFEREREAEQNSRNGNSIARVEPEFMNSNSMANAEQLQRMLKVYLKIVNRRLIDRIPLTLMQNLLSDLSDTLEKECISYPTSLKPGEINNKVVENAKLQKERNSILSKIKRLQEAQQELAVF